MEADEILARFQDGQLSHSEWTHRAHLLVAACYLAEHPPERALPELREKIQRLNLAHGVFTTAGRGYHETLTRVWLLLVLEARALLGPVATPEAVADRLVSDKERLLRHYSRQRLGCWESRVGWLPPDLEPFSFDPGLWQPVTPPLISLRVDGDELDR